MEMEYYFRFLVECTDEPNEIIAEHRRLVVKVPKDKPEAAEWEFKKKGVLLQDKKSKVYYYLRRQTYGPYLTEDAAKTLPPHVGVADTPVMVG